MTGDPSERLCWIGHELENVATNDRIEGFVKIQFSRIAVSEGDCA
jgi:hypothetical protein